MSKLKQMILVSHKTYDTQNSYMMPALSLCGKAARAAVTACMWIVTGCDNADSQGNIIQWPMLWR